MASFVAYHGWGFDRHCWREWEQFWRQRGHEFHCCDRGYFGSPQGAKFEGDRPHLLLVHSFGLHLCSPDIVAAADGVVLFNSFLHFHPAEPRLQRRSQRTLQKMGDRLRNHPQAVLQAFWQNCYDNCYENCYGEVGAATVPRWPDSIALESLDQPLLQADLDALNTAHLTADSPVVQAMGRSPAVWVIHSSADRIVPLSQGDTLADAVATHELIVIPEAGHALPFSHPRHCWTLAPFTAL